MLEMILETMAFYIAMNLLYYVVEMYRMSKGSFGTYADSLVQLVSCGRFTPAMGEYLTTQIIFRLQYIQVHGINRQVVLYIVMFMFFLPANIVILLPIQYAALKHPDMLDESFRQVALDYLNKVFRGEYILMNRKGETYDMSFDEYIEMKSRINAFPLVKRDQPQQ